MNSLKIQNEVKELFYQSKFEECIQRADEECSKDIDFISFQTLQLYKSLTLLEMSKLNEGHACMQQLIEKSQEKKGNKVDEIDLMIQILYQWQQFDRNNDIAEQRNSILNEKIQLFKEQNDLTQDHLNGIYQFGLSMYKFIETYRNDKDLECIELLRKSLELAPIYKQEIINQLGWMYDYKSYSNESIEWNEKLFHMNPNFPGITNNLALLYKHQDNLEQAQKYFQKAEELQPNNSIILTNIGQYYDSVNNSELAEKYFKKAYEINPYSGNACLKYGQFLLSQQKKDEALQILQQGIKNEPNYCQLYLELYDIEYDNQNYDLCQDYLQKCIEITPENGYYYYRIAQFQFDMEDYENAIENINISLKMKLNEKLQYYANSLKGTCFYRLNQHKESLQQYLTILNTEQKDIETEAANVNYIINHSDLLSVEDKISQINNEYGIIQMRYNLMIEQILNPKIVNSIQHKQDTYRQILSILAYTNSIQPYITFQSQVSHWDLFID